MDLEMDLDQDNEEQEEYFSDDHKLSVDEESKHPAQGKPTEFTASQEDLG